MRNSVLDELGDLYATKGSRPWAIAVRDMLNEALHDQEFSVGSVRDWYDSIREHDGWKVLTDQNEKLFVSFEAFCTHRKPFGLGHNPDYIERIIQERKDKEASQLAMEAEPLNRVGPPIGNTNAVKEEENNVGVTNIVLGNIGRKRSESSSSNGTTKEYLTARIARDKPEILERMKAGEFKSVRAAAIEAGIVKVETGLDIMKRGWNRSSQAERELFFKWVENPEK